MLAYVIIVVLFIGACALLYGKLFRKKSGSTSMGGGGGGGGSDDNKPHSQT